MNYSPAEDGQTNRGVFCIRIFPAKFRDQYISVRSWNANGDEVEIGIIEDLKELSEDNRKIVETTLARHYLLRRIERVNKVTLTHGYLDFDVETDAGHDRFSMRWTASQAIDFGKHGRLLIDTDDNRYVVEDVAKLPKPDRERFLQYVYW